MPVTDKIAIGRLQKEISASIQNANTNIAESSILQAVIKESIATFIKNNKENTWRVYIGGEKKLSKTIKEVFDADLREKIYQPKLKLVC